MKMNVATGRSSYAFHWMDKLSKQEKSGVQMWRDSGLPDNALMSTLIKLLDSIEETQGGQLALQEKKT